MNKYQIANLSRERRTINNKIYIFNIDGTLELFYIKKPTKHMQSIKQHQGINLDILTLDIEHAHKLN